MTTVLLPAPRKSVIFKDMDDGAVLYCTASEVYFGLNPTGAHIWRFLERGAGGRAELAGALEAEFPDAPAETLREDIDAFLSELRDAGLVTDARSTATE